MKKNRKWISLLNFEGDVFKVVKYRNYLDTYDIVDYKGHSVREGITGIKVLAIYDGLDNIKTSDGRLYDISREHSSAKPTRDALLVFLGMYPVDLNLSLDQSSSENNFSISFILTNKQQARFDEWKEAIKKIYGEYGHFSWTISPTGVCHGLEVWSSLAKTNIDLTDMDDY